MGAARFERDDDNDAANQAKHHVSFTQAQHAFMDRLRVMARDLGHSQAEEGFYCFGNAGVRFTHRQGVVRIIGAGYWRRGKSAYEKENQRHG
ncbi:MAG TPA: BrnT family toxin [Burkholderiaceae bacterium]